MKTKKQNTSLQSYKDILLQITTPSHPTSLHSETHFETKNNKWGLKYSF